MLKILHYQFFFLNVKRNMLYENSLLIVYKYVLSIKKVTSQRNSHQFLDLKQSCKIKLKQCNLSHSILLVKYHRHHNNQIWYKVLTLNTNHLHNLKIIGILQCLSKTDHLKIQYGHKVGNILLGILSIINFNNRLFHINLHITLLNQTFFHNFKIKLILLINHFNYHQHYTPKPAQPLPNPNNKNSQLVYNIEG